MNKFVKKLYNLSADEIKSLKSVEKRKTLSYAFESLVKEEDFKGMKKLIEHIEGNKPTRKYTRRTN